MIGKKAVHAVLVMALVVVGQWSVWAFVAQSGESLEPAIASGVDYPNCRLGVGATRNSITTYNVTPMRFGWYIDWRAPLSPIRPAGMDYYHTLRVKQNKSGSTYLPTYQITPTLDFSPNGLGPIVQANPGSVWIIGNEPDRIFYQDESLPDMYAEIYHDAYTFIKGIDPTAKVAIGGVIQPTPVRLQYLDMVLSAYRTKYGGAMPIDVWNVHMYILQEIAGSWGASIPPGIDATTGTLFTVPQHIDTGVFSSLVRDMRTWMKSRGYQNTPLIITEYGVLFPLYLLDDYGFTQADLNDYLSTVVSFLMSATDANLGYPADNYRLVQQAALYSLDDDSLNQFGEFRWGGFLFRSTAPYTLTETGSHYQSLAASLPASVDLLPVAASTEPASLIVSPGESITLTFKVLVSNAGNSPPLSATLPVSPMVRFYDVTGGSNTLVGEVTLAPFTGCGALREASVVWPNLSPGLYLMRVEIDPADQIEEAIESNNAMTVAILVGTHGVYLPTLRK